MEFMSLSFFLASGALLTAAGVDVDFETLVGQPADVAPSAYAYRSDRPAEQNPPESWVGLLQYSSLPFDRRVDPNAPAFKSVLGALLWEEVRPIRQVELSWGEDA